MPRLVYQPSKNKTAFIWREKAYTRRHNQLRKRLGVRPLPLLIFSLLTNLNWLIYQPRYLVLKVKIKLTI